jgi:hypothetical protein
MQQLTIPIPETDDPEVQESFRILSICTNSDAIIYEEVNKLILKGLSPEFIKQQTKIRNIDKYLKVNHLVPELKERFIKGEVKLAQAVVIADKPKVDQKEYNLEGKITSEAIKEVDNYLKEKYHIPQDPIPGLEAVVSPYQDVLNDLNRLKKSVDKTGDKQLTGYLETMFVITKDELGKLN